MISACFVGLNPWTLIVLTIIFTIVAIYLVLVSHQAEKKGTYISIGFAALTILSLLLFTCWAIVVALLELVVGFLMNRDKLKILRIS